MAKLNLGLKNKAAPQGSTWQETLVGRIRQGKALPFLSNVVLHDLIFGSYDDVVETWADYIDYPLTEQSHDLTQMTQFENVRRQANPQIKADAVHIKELYLDFLKAALVGSVPEEQALEVSGEISEISFSEAAKRLSLPRFDQDTPLQDLAKLPLPIFLTTSPHDFIEVALRWANKDPRTEICYWHDGLRSIPSVFTENPTYRPSPEEPLVYHLHGLDEHPASLVLTEDDHLDFLVAISQTADAVPVRVQQALTDSSLVMLGYRLASWDFRVLFRGLIKPRPTPVRQTNVAIQLSPDEVQKSYLQNYLAQAEFEVYWGDVPTFLQEIWEGLEG